ncbi:MAG TPA: hypothetical protein VFT29_06185 [Gemmatimonadaceae bacterium]|nr:hypothetical protein [Gemmatimonadaceae bacterium]
MLHSRWHPARAAPLLLLALSGCAATHDAVAPDPDPQQQATPEVEQQVLAQLGTDPLVLDLLDEIGDATVTIAGVTLTRGQGRGNNASGDAATQQVAREALTYMVESAVSDAGT